MAVLEKIRVKMGAFITVLIAVALLSFIIDPSTLESTWSMFSSKYDVGEINGKSVTYRDYQKKIDYFTQVYQMTAGSNSSDDKTQEMINNSAWQDEIAERILIPAAKNAGLKLGDEELLDLSQGKNISPILANEASFRDANGAFDKTKLAQFVQAVSQDQSGQLQMYWNYLEDNMVKDQLFTKYVSLLEKSSIVNPVELSRAIANNNTTYDVDFVVKPFGFAADTTIAVTSQEIKNYYDKNKHNFKQQASKDLEYVVFEVVPSTEDIDLAEKDLAKVYDEFTTTANMKNFLVRNSDQPYNPYFFKESELRSLAPVIADFAATAKTGDILPAFREENTFIAARIMDIKAVPDSVFVRHILLQGADEQKADSLIAVLNKGGNFAQLATEYSADKNPNVEQPGDLGWMTQQYIIPGFEEIFTSPKGNILKLKTNYGLHLVEVTKNTQPMKKIQVALLVKEAVAGKQTYANYYAKTNELAAKSEGNLEKFKAAAKELNLTTYPAMRVLASAKTIANYERAREVTRWMNENKVGSVSPIISVDNKYFFVVGITGEHEAGIATLNEVAPQIKQLLTLEKKGAKMAAETKELVAGASNIEAVAEKLGTTVNHQSGIAFSSLTSQQLDPKFVGAVAAAQEGTLVGPVEGEIGIYYFTVTGKETGAFYTEDDARKRKTQEFSYVVRILPAIMAEDAGVKDLRYKFF